MSSASDDHVDGLDDLDDTDADATERWEEVELPDGTTVRIPDASGHEFPDRVEVLADASGGVASFGPMVSEDRELICRVGDVYFVRSCSDGDESTKVVGRFEDRCEGLAACIAASEAFVPDIIGWPCSAWSDEDLDHEISDWDVWDPDEYDEDTPASSDKRELWDRLHDTTITHEGVVIAGEGATSTLPARGCWYVIPCDEEQARHLDRVVRGTGWVEVRIAGRTRRAVLSDRVAGTTAARVASAFGAEHFWELDEDAIRTVSTDTERPVAIAEAPRRR